MKENKKKIIPLVMSVIAIILIVIGASYAWFTLQLNGTKVNVLKAGTLSLVLDDINSIGINEDKAVPMLDEVGEILDPYHFTLENSSDTLSEYTIYLDDVDLEEEETRMSDGFIKYSLTKDEEKTTQLLSAIGENPNRILDTGTIDGNTTITYDLRLWIDQDANNDVMGTVFKGKIRIVATQVQNVARENKNILKVYNYSIEDETKCITGEETTCIELTERPTTYEAGTIIKYKVNDTEEKYFYVMFDNNDGTLTLQQRENTISEIAWSSEDWSNGPLTVLPALESATASWTNVNDQKYTMGTTVFKTNAFTGCEGTECTENVYTLPERTAKSRMITVQEAASLGCQYNVIKTCPVWMYNYLKDASANDGTNEGTDMGYWTMSALPEPDVAHDIQGTGKISTTVTPSGADTGYEHGARAVIVINK